MVVCMTVLWHYVCICFCQLHFVLLQKLEIVYISFFIWRRCEEIPTLSGSLVKDKRLALTGGPTTVRISSYLTYLKMKIKLFSNIFKYVGIVIQNFWIMN